MLSGPFFSPAKERSDAGASPSPVSGRTFSFRLCLVFPRPPEHLSSPPSFILFQRTPYFRRHPLPHFRSAPQCAFSRVLPGCGIAAFRVAFPGFSRNVPPVAKCMSPGAKNCL